MLTKPEVYPRVVQVNPLLAQIDLTGNPECKRISISMSAGVQSMC